MANNFKFLDAAGLTKVWNKINSVFAKKADVNGEQSAWNTDVSYSAGDYVIHDGKLWECTLANRGQTPQNNAYWQNVSLKQINTDLTQMIDVGTNYIKMANGVLICFGRFGYSVTPTTQTGNVWDADLTVDVSFPITFTSIPSLTVTIGGVGDAQAVVARVMYNEQKINKVLLQRGSAGQLYTQYCNYIAIGRWK